MNRYLPIITIALCAACFPILCRGGFDAPVDMEEARELCDKSALSDIEGLWRYPGDNTVVIVMKDSGKTDSYGIWIVESLDCRLDSGKRIGTLTASADVRKYRLTMFTSLKRDKFSDPCTCMATLSDKKESLIIERADVSLKFNPLGFLPYFWRSIRVKTTFPSEKIPEGMIKIYPGFDSEGSTTRNPRYL